MPGDGETIPKGGTVILYTGGEAEQNTVSVPKFIGMTPAQANQEAASKGLNIVFPDTDLSGAGVKIYEQDPPEGTAVPPVTVVTVKIRDETVVDDS